MYIYFIILFYPHKFIKENLKNCAKHVGNLKHLLTFKKHLKTNGRIEIKMN